jgi:hypothetical protein
MTTYRFATVKDARKAGVGDATIKKIVEQVSNHRQAVDADRANRKRIRKAARIARRAARA